MFKAEIMCKKTTQYEQNLYPKCGRTLILIIYIYCIYSYIFEHKNAFAVFQLDFEIFSTKFL